MTSAFLTRYPLMFSLLLIPFLAQADARPDWPRHLSTSKGEVVLKQPPRRIVSTSVTLTGSLLAIEAPVIASGVTQPGKRLADDRGFFRQWGDIASARGVKPLPTGEASLEAIAAQDPDLIVVSATGKDSAVTLYDRLSLIAPTLVINYDQQSWQQTERQLAKATGKETEAEASIQSFARRVAAVKAAIVLPPQPVSALVFNPQSQAANLWTRDSAQGQLLESLGFTLATVPAELAQAQRRLQRKDIIPLSGESLVTGINGQSVLMFAADQSGKVALLSAPLLAASPAVQHQQVYTLGNDSFRLDYYSANHLLTRLRDLFAAH